MTLCDSPLMRIKTGGLCDRLIASCRRLFAFSGDGFPIGGDSSVESLVRIIEQMERWAGAHDLSFMATKQWNDDEVTFVLYREETELELRVFHFFLSPAESLPEATAALYKRFICFVAASLGISVTPEHTDNRYLDMFVNQEEWYENDEDEVPEAFCVYYSDERVRQLFCEVRDADIRDLGYDLAQHRKECDPKVLDLVELMMEGMEVVPPMCVGQYDFNPYRDGFSDGDGEIELLSTLAVLYSPNDGMEEAILEAINSDNYCGLVPQGWNRWLILSPDITREEYEALTDNSGTAKRFLDWSERFYEESEKFDKYKKEEK